jgi:SynChlorMet cassette radical SAM/SPASM protein ScmF
MSSEDDAIAALASSKKTIRPNLPDGIPPLTSLYLYIAGSCNLACRHCWITPTYRPDGKDGKFLELRHVQKAILEAKPLGLRSVKLTGGEPTLHPQFKELVSLIHENGLDIIIETNGTLIDDSLAIFLKQNEVSFISVSLDGATAEVHDYLRSVAGSYERALKGINALVQVGYRVQLICTLYQGNIHQMSEIVALANQLGCGSVKFNHVQSVGRGERFAEAQGLDVPEVIRLYRQVEETLKPNSCIPIFFDIPMAFFSISKLLNDHLGSCNIRNILGVLAGGELSLCGIGVTVPELIYGRIEQDDIYEIWCHAPGLAQLRDLIPVHMEGICGQCLHRDLCQGECVANNLHVSGRLNAPYFFCEQAESLGLFPILRKKL